MSDTNETKKKGRHANKRLSPLRVLGGLGIVVAIVAGGVTVPFLINNEANAETVQAGPRWFGGYFDVTAAKVSEMPTETVEGPSNVVLAFVVAASANSCEPSWGTYYDLDGAAKDLDLDRRIARIRQDGSDVTVSFGGAINTELASACTSTSDLVTAYGAVIDRYDLSMIDLDIEAGNLAHTASGERRAEAVAQLQKQATAKGTHLQVWLTLPVSTTGLLDDGLAVVDQMMAAGVDLSGVNVMTMDYGTDLQGKSMGETSVDALTATERQLTALYAKHAVQLPAEGAWSVLGATPMIGQNDIADEVFTMADAATLNSFATSKSLARMSMWSLNRDRTCGPNYPDISVVSNSCSGVDQGGATFSAALAAGFGGHPAPTTMPTARPTATETKTPRPTATVADDPATSPYPIWSADAAYSSGVRVVWGGNVYAAKWWVQGGSEPDDPTMTATETAWTLVGPVLPTDVPWALPTVPAGTYPDWSATGTYVKGDKVIFNGTPFEAQWWTQGDNPTVGITDHDRSPWEVFTG